MKLAITVAVLAALRWPVPLAKAPSALDELSRWPGDRRCWPGLVQGRLRWQVGVPFEQRRQRFEYDAPADQRHAPSFGQLRAAAPATARRWPLGACPRRRCKAAGSQRGSGAMGPRGWYAPHCPADMMAGLPRHGNTTPGGFQWRPGRSWAMSSKASKGRPATSRMRWSRSGPGLLAAGSEADRVLSVRDRRLALVRRDPAEQRGRIEAGSAAECAGAAVPLCSARGASESTSGKWVMSRAR